MSIRATISLHAHLFSTKGNKWFLIHKHTSTRFSPSSFLGLNVTFILSTISTNLIVRVQYNAFNICIWNSIQFLSHLGNLLCLGYNSQTLHEHEMMTQKYHTRTIDRMSFTILCKESTHTHTYNRTFLMTEIFPCRVSLEPYHLIHSLRTITSTWWLYAIFLITFSNIKCLVICWEFFLWNSPPENTLPSKKMVRFYHN